jgi:GNAT superfamily N-acetyltransferase
VEGARPATAADVLEILELERTARALAAEQRGGPVWLARHPAHGDRVGELIESPSDLVLVGTIDDAVVGYAVAHLQHVDDGAPLGMLRDVFVDPAARGVGVGAALLDAVLAWAEAQGCRGLDSTALPGDRATKNFFESYGMVARAIEVHRPIGEQP